MKLQIKMSGRLMGHHPNHIQTQYGDWGEPWIQEVFYQGIYQNISRGTWKQDGVYLGAPFQDRIPRRSTKIYHGATEAYQRSVYFYSTTEVRYYLWNPIKIVLLSVWTENLVIFNVNQQQLGASYPRCYFSFILPIGTTVPVKVFLL